MRSSPSPSYQKAWGSAAVDKPLSMGQGWAWGICVSLEHRVPASHPPLLCPPLYLPFPLFPLTVPIPYCLPLSSFLPLSLLPFFLLPSFIFPFLSSSLPISFPPFLLPSFPQAIYISQAPAKHEGRHDGSPTVPPEGTCSLEREAAASQGSLLWAQSPGVGGGSSWRK